MNNLSSDLNIEVSKIGRVMDSDIYRTPHRRGEVDNLQIRVLHLDVEDTSEELLVLYGIIGPFSAWKDTTGTYSTEKF